MLRAHLRVHISNCPSPLGPSSVWLKDLRVHIWNFFFFNCLNWYNVRSDRGEAWAEWRPTWSTVGTVFLSWNPSISHCMLQGTSNTQSTNNIDSFGAKKHIHYTFSRIRALQWEIYEKAQAIFMDPTWMHDNCKVILCIKGWPNISLIK